MGKASEEKLTGRTTLSLSLLEGLAVLVGEYHRKC